MLGGLHGKHAVQRGFGYELCICSKIEEKEKSDVPLHAKLDCLPHRVVAVRLLRNLPTHPPFLDSVHHLIFLKHYFPEADCASVFR